MMAVNMPKPKPKKNRFAAAAVEAPEGVKSGLDYQDPVAEPEAAEKPRKSIKAAKAEESRGGRKPTGRTVHIGTTMTQEWVDDINRLKSLTGQNLSVLLEDALSAYVEKHNQTHPTH